MRKKLEEITILSEGNIASFFFIYLYFGIVASGIGYLEEAYDYFSQSARMDLDDYHNNFMRGFMQQIWQEHGKQL